MNELEDQEQRALRDARQQFAPTATDARRVLDATRAALAEGVVPVPRAEPAEEAASSASSRLAETWTARGWLLRGAFVVAVAAVSGTIGYRLGLRAGPEVEARPATADTLVAGTPGAEALQRPAAPSIVRAPATAQSDSPPPVATPVPEARPARRPAATATQVPAHPSLEEELRGLRRVERALREQQPRVALELLGELDRSVPEGKLGEERLAAFHMARCALGFGTADVLVREFEQRYPGSVYRARVRQACAAGVPVADR